MHTTKTKENFNRQLRKVTKNKTIFPNDCALQKSLYLAMVDASSKWASRICGWDQILSQLSIFFEGRF
ncbi:transposase [Anaerococcus porci]|uniref:transposase n=1 Tax=Anaerococcus porci TaxID=2652269 RepID=UPI002A762936|nr:transposase [Anaerococcus porci]MDY3006429.1 transposase [Anaerococcus porci]